MTTSHELHRQWKMNSPPLIMVHFLPLFAVLYVICQRTCDSRVTQIPRDVTDVSPLMYGYKDGHIHAISVATGAFVWSSEHDREIATVEALYRLGKYLLVRLPDRLLLYEVRVGLHLDHSSCQCCVGV